MVNEHSNGQASEDGEPTPGEAAPAELEAVHNEVLRKVGRNLLLFQQLEVMLQFLVANAGFAGFKSDFPRLLEKRAEAISKRTMG